MNLLEVAAIFLLSAVLLVPLFQRLKLGAVLGYLAAGMLLGPWGIGLVPDAEHTLGFAELGIALLLFLVGLELEPARLWALRRLVFGMGGAQVAITGAVLALIAVSGSRLAHGARRGLRSRDVVDRARAVVAHRARTARNEATAARRSRCFSSRTSS